MDYNQEPSSSFLNTIKALPKEYWYIFVFHLSKNNLPYLRSWIQNVPTLGVVSIAYSEQREVKNEIQKLAAVYSMPFEEIPDFIKRLCGKNLNKKIVLVEIGGYSALVADELSNVVLAVEDTARGHERFREHEGKLTYPVVSIARTEGKMLEDEVVGRAIAISLEKFWVEGSFSGSLKKKQICVLGYGGVGRGAVKFLKYVVKEVKVYDINPDIQKKIEDEGIGGAKASTLSGADIILGCSGHRSLSMEDISSLKDGVLLISGSSRQVEFPYELLAPFKTKLKTAAPLEEFVFNGKRLLIAYKGQPLNFYYDIDLGPIFDITMTLLAQSVNYGLGTQLDRKLYNLPSEENNKIVENAKTEGLLQ